MNKAILAHCVVIVGVLLMVAGVYGVGGWQVASIVAGVCATTYGLIFVDVDGKVKPHSNRTIERRQR